MWWGGGWAEGEFLIQELTIDLYNYLTVQRISENLTIIIQIIFGS